MKIGKKTAGIFVGQLIHTAKGAVDRWTIRDRRCAPFVYLVYGMLLRMTCDRNWSGWFIFYFKSLSISV